MLTVKAIGAFLGSAVAAFLSEKLRDTLAEENLAMTNQHLRESRDRSALIHRRIWRPE